MKKKKFNFNMLRQKYKIKIRNPWNLFYSLNKWIVFIRNYQFSRMNRLLQPNNN
jgi:hypothetical protein